MAKPKAKKKKGLNKTLIKEPVADKNITKESIGIYEKIDYPLFSFKYLYENSIDNCDDSNFFFNFLKRLKKLSQLGWNEIRTSPHHSFGMEKISKDSIIPQPQYPEFITPDVKEFSVFRSNGNNTGLVGFQIEKIFFVFFIETRHGDIYRH